MNLNSNPDTTTPKEPENAKLYVGNLPFSVDDNTLKSFFETALGPDSVQSAQVVIDRERNRSKGFGFVSFASADLAQKAAALSGQEITAPDGNKRPISIDQAHERKERSGGGNRGNFPRNFGGNNRFGNSGGGSGGRPSWSGGGNSGGGGYNRDRGNSSGGERTYSSGNEGSGSGYSSGGGNYGGGGGYSGGGSNYGSGGGNFGGGNNYGGGGESFGGGAKKPGSKGNTGGFKKKPHEKEDDWW
ncbi:MAG: hypothetical protein SFU25_11890 [Candidatus Caenarcaniphilales bacterium]|nr:hypothetical protein [Candidatus Caenarcaniphilales bacterium]